MRLRVEKGECLVDQSGQGVLRLLVKLSLRKIKDALRYVSEVISFSGR